MGKKNRQNHPQTDAYGQPEGFFDNDGMNVVSDTEYTGMIPTPPGGCDDRTSYREIGDIPAEPTEIGDPSENKPKKKAHR